MTVGKQRLVFAAAVLGVLGAFFLPLSDDGAAGLASRPALLVAILAAAAFYAAAVFTGTRLSTLAAFAGTLPGAGVALVLLRDAAIDGHAASGFWLLVLAIWLAAGMCIAQLATIRSADPMTARALDLAVPVLFGALVFFLWEVAVRGLGVPTVLLPAPSLIGLRFFGSLWTLWQDFFQTFVLGVLSGYAVGCGAGFLIAIVAHRHVFLERGLLPIGNFVSALPIVGIAPIMVMWFGFDWPSKAAVVTVITFFPMLVNTLAGLSVAGAMERDLMRSYGADQAQTLRKLYLPAALPFIFNGLKINSTLAFIGAIVAEFFGTPTVGIGFRISIEAGRMALDMVWAEIMLAAIAGMAFYGIVALAERATTFWHPSYRT